MSSKVISGRVRGLIVFVPLLLAALLLSTLSPQSANASTSSGTTADNWFSRLLQLGSLSQVTTADDADYVPATRYDPNATVGDGVSARASTGAGIVFPGGPGHPDKVYAVKWFSDDRAGFCYRFVLHNPNSSGANLASVVPGMTADESKHAFYVVNKYSKSNNNVDVAAAALVIWHFEDSPQFKRWFGWSKANGNIGAAVMSAYKRILSESSQHGPYKMSINITDKAVSVGQKGRATVSVKSAHGRPVGGRKVTLSGSNAVSTRSTWVTNKKGKVLVRFERTDIGRVRLVARMSTYGVKGYLTNPGDGNQSLVLTGPTYRASASDGYQASMKAPKVTARCSTDCDGTAPVTVEGCVPSGATKARFFVGTSTKGRGKFDVTAGNCKKMTKTFEDGDVVVVVMCYVKNDKCVTDRVQVATYKVQCPPWAKARVTITSTMSCESCSSALKELAFWAPGSSSRYFRGFYTVDGGETKTINIATDGEWHTVSGLPNGSKVVIGFRVYKNSDYTGKIFEHTWTDCPNCD